MGEQHLQVEFPLISTNMKTEYFQDVLYHWSSSSQYIMWFWSMSGEQNYQSTFFEPANQCQLSVLLTLFRMGVFGAAHGWGGAPSLKPVTHILQWWNLSQLHLPKEDPKNMNHVTHPLSSATSAFFHRKSANFALSRNTDIDCILIHDFYLF